MWYVRSSYRNTINADKFVLSLGGIARFRVYGRPIPVFPSDEKARFDMASVLLGARVVFTSNQHYGVGSNLILPGRGPANMDGGWETRRSREPGHSDHVIVKLFDPIPSLSYNRR